MLVRINFSGLRQLPGVEKIKEVLHFSRMIVLLELNMITGLLNTGFQFFDFKTLQIGPIGGILTFISMMNTISESL